MTNKKIISACVLILLLLNFCNDASGQFPRFRVLAFYSDSVEPDHVAFAREAIEFFKDLTVGDGFVFDTTSNMDDLNDDRLKNYSVVMMIDDFPHSQAQRESFRRYMENGGGWFGFHVAAYNDKDTKWPWRQDFYGCNPEQAYHRWPEMGGCY
jgi:hypothetical protein